MNKLMIAASFLFLPLASAVDAATPTPAAFDRFVRETGSACASAASSACFERIFRFADNNRDGALDLAEAEIMRDHARQWVLAHSGELHPADKRGAVVTLLAIDYVGIDELFASYDVDGDDLLTREEVSADIALDDRPVMEVARDPDAVDWDRLIGRLGSGAAMLKDVLPKRKTS